MMPRHIDDLLCDFRLSEFTKTAFETEVWFGQLADRELVKVLWCDGLGIEDALLREGAQLDREDVRVVRDGVLLRTGTLANERRAPLGEPDAEAIEEVVRGGHTLAVTLNHRRGAMGAVVALVEEAFRCSSHAVVYITPPVARGFDLHHDEDDVFVVQLEGSKLWRWAPPEVRWPFASGRHESVDVERLRTASLRAGDVLYLPRGTIHAAETTGDASVHLTMSLPLTRVFQRDLQACILALGERADRELAVDTWDDPSSEDDLVTELVDTIATLELNELSGAAERIRTNRFWLERALRGTR